MDTNESLERAAALRAEADEAERAAQAEAETQSFDQFWAEVRAQDTPRYETILGVRVKVPQSMTLRFRERLAAVDMSATSEDDVRQILSDLFGEGTLDQWIDAGMDETQLAVVMAWAIACAAGREITWPEAYEAVTAGKAPASLAKERALQNKQGGSTQRSGGTGGRSRGGRSRKGSARKR